MRMQTHEMVGELWALATRGDALPVFVAQPAWALMNDTFASAFHPRYRDVKLPRDACDRRSASA